MRAGRRVSSYHVDGSLAHRRGPSTFGNWSFGRPHGPCAAHDAYEDHDLGVFHRTELTPCGESGSPRSASSTKGALRTDVARQAVDQVANAPTQCFVNWESQEQQNTAIELLSKYLAKLPRGALVFEIGSRCGEIVTTLARRFPGLWIQPTEGTGRTSHSLHILLEERVKQFGRELEQEGISHPDADEDGTGGRVLGIAGRVLKPRFFDAGKLEEWLAETHSHHNHPSIIFVINILHFMSWKCVETILEGSSRTLRSGGALFLCGPFFDSGNISDDNLLFHAALGDFVQILRDRGEKQVEWGLHDVRRIQECGEAHGLELESKTQIGDADRAWLAVIFRRPGATKRRNVGLASWQRRNLMASEKHMLRVSIAQ